MSYSTELWSCDEAPARSTTSAPSWLCTMRCLLPSGPCQRTSESKARIWKMGRTSELDRCGYGVAVSFCHLQVCQYVVDFFLPGRLWFVGCCGGFWVVDR